MLATPTFLGKRVYRRSVSIQHLGRFTSEERQRNSYITKNTRRGISPDGRAAYDRASAAKAFLSFTCYCK